MKQLLTPVCRGWREAMGKERSSKQTTSFRSKMYLHLSRKEHILLIH